MRFPGIRLVEETKQKFVAFESVLKNNKKEKKTVTVIVGQFYHIKAPTKNSFEMPTKFTLEDLRKST